MLRGKGYYANQKQQQHVRSTPGPVEIQAGYTYQQHLCPQIADRKKDKEKYSVKQDVLKRVKQHPYKPHRNTREPEQAGAYFISDLHTDLTDHPGSTGIVYLLIRPRARGATCYFPESPCNEPGMIDLLFLNKMVDRVIEA